MSKLLHLPLVILLLATHAAAQTEPSIEPQPESEPAAQAAAGPEGPKDVFRKFFEYMGRYADAKNPEDLHHAGRLFVLDDVLKGDQEYIGDSAARDLLNFLDRALREVPVYRIPAQHDEPAYVYQAEYKTADGDIAYASIELVRNPAGTWLFSAATRQAAAELYQQVAHSEPKFGKGGVRDATTWLRDHAPAWMHRRGFLLDHWQWVGLLGLILLGLLASALARLLTMIVRAWAMARRNVTSATRGWRRSRPFGLMATAVTWYFCLHFLALPEKSYSALMLAIRLFLMVGSTWAVCSLIDYVTEILAALAQKTGTKIDDVVVPMVRRALKILVVALGIVWIADNLDMDVGALLAGLGIGGLALALAAKDTVENFFGAVSILADRPFEVGDWILMEDVEGTVEHVGFRSTRVRTFYNSLITVPNALMTRAKVDNLGARVYRRYKANIGVTYDTPPDRLEAFVEGIRELIRRHPYTRKDYYHVYFNGYGECSLNILLYVFFKTPDWATELRERHRFLIDILRLAAELNVEFAFPTRTLHMVPAAAAAETDRFTDIAAASSVGRKTAREIVERFTGKGVPPPVVLSKDPRDDAAEDGDG